jgi:hypothetical protein
MAQMNDNDIVNLLKDRTKLEHYLLDMITSSDKFSENLPQLRDKGWSEKGMLDKVLEISSIQSQQIKHLALIALLLVHSKEFDSIIAHTMMEMGRGQEALQEMLRRKMNRGY